MFYGIYFLFFVKQHNMSIEIILTEKNIMETPNDMELGAFVREKYLSTKSKEKLDSENNFVCSICGINTNEIDGDYLIGCDHLSCVLKNNLAGNE